jgi:hypothetical protein
MMSAMLRGWRAEPICLYKAARQVCRRLLKSKAELQLVRYMTELYQHYCFCKLKLKIKNNFAFILLKGYLAER